ncbi:pilus assembly protein [Gilvimarinus algae]|uniref:PilC/PilY family type IV pilus protein n=1 Tax=Gilvimarinus algae TaxID=3058037 RepID=A0ABT8T9H8_9GAMM|nr:PilC/PilY family type IV pilus protein [Gilvimarinus sp. SDUM040014]MDO3380797.1 PilC/PilY family type IV pilus protein [Gilvimarinus sp. SDUM040014]
MNKTSLIRALTTAKRSAVAVVASIVALGSAHSVHAINLAQSPLFLARPVTPIVMLNMSNDHQLFFKAYDDYSDLDGDGFPDTTYKNSYDYYGYFDSNKCYTHDGEVFRPSGNASGHYCSGKWSGNFLNWATMTRVDAVRKILYGGKRSESGDTATSTILERAMLPQDAHAFAKYYNGSDLNRLTPYSVTSGLSATADTGITICNSTNPTGTARDQESQNVTSPPMMHVARGNYSLWASNEGWQCRWGTGTNDNDSAISGIYAYSSSPVASTRRLNDLEVQVEVCNSSYMDLDNNENCKGYSEGLKPIGLLQRYGEDDTIHFGLMTGSYSLNKSGGVLRRNVGSIADEVNADGTFKTPPDGSLGVIGTLDALRISRYSFSSGQYNATDKCPWELAYFSDGACSNWGNPQSEIYLESLRYLAGKGPNFATDDSTRISGLGEVNWVDPINNDNYCAPLAVLQFNASTSSYDSDQLTGFGDIANGKSLSALTDFVGQSEGIHGNTYFVGETGANKDQLCTAKTVSKLSEVKGTCPDAPRLGGSYQIAGLAYHARVNGIGADRETVQTFGVALAPAVPRVDVRVPGSTNRTISIQPACRNSTPNPDANCAIVDFKIIEQDNTGSIYRGKLYVNWEDSEQGGDFDQDMWGIIEYRLDSEELEVTTRVIAQSTPNSMGFGYVVSGTNKDGFHVHSGINHFAYTHPDPTALSCSSTGANQCDCRDGFGRCNSSYSAATTQVFGVESSAASALQQPLYYAAKWGGFDTLDEEGNEVSVPPAGDPETYFFATDPRELEASLYKAVEAFAEGAGSATAVATNSTRLGTDSIAYQATFNTTSWTGDLIAAALGEGGLSAPLWSAASQLPTPSSRNIWTHNGSAPVEFQWGNLSPIQRNLLGGSVASSDPALEQDGFGESRVQWTRGTDVPGFAEREADKKLGDIVNSNPKFSGAQNYGFGMSQANGASSYESFVASKTEKTVFVGANDGMLHAFNAVTGRERFAYIPSNVYEQLRRRTAANYGSSVNPHKYSVDGQIFVGDAYYGGRWRTILVGTMGAGAKGIFALDVTNPGSFNAGDVLFEYTEGNAPEIGNITGTPIIAPMPDGSWAVVTGNGYNSQSGRAQLVIIPLDGTYTPRYIDTGLAGDNGLSEPSISVGGGFLSRYAYAGDLKGKLYKFDLQNMSVSYTLFETESGQPITSAPILGINPYRKFSDGRPGTMVYFGTGSYLTLGDLSNVDLQSFYGIADTGGAVAHSALFTKDIVSEGASGREVYQGDGPYGDEIDWQTYAGWYLDFDTEEGERVIDKPILSYDRVIFPTVIPTDSPCDFGGRSWIMALIGVGGLYSAYSPFDSSVPDGGNGGGESPPDGIENDTIVKLTPPSENGAPCGGGGFIIQQNSDGTVEYICTGEPDVVEGRQSWRQIQ